MMSAEQRGRGPINRACLIQPQPSLLPSSLCLREDTTAVTQTAVYPLLLAAARGIIHMLLCQESGKKRQKKRERKKKKGKREKDVAWREMRKKTSIKQSVCASSLYNQLLMSCFLFVSITHCSLKWRWKRCGATCRWLGGDAFQERVHMFLIILWLSQPTAAGETLEDGVCKSLRNMQKEKAKSSKFDIAHKWNQNIVPLFF